MIVFRIGILFVLLIVSVSGVSDSIFDDEISLSILFGLMLELPSFFFFFSSLFRPFLFHAFGPSVCFDFECSCSYKKFPVLVTPSLGLFA